MERSRKIAEGAETLALAVAHPRTWAPREPLDATATTGGRNDGAAGLAGFELIAKALGVPHRVKLRL